ncbi:MAG: hypothetical protein Q8S53_08460 [Brevundimonas sp.]|uniref:hypothetical protein n=1 Tax=Brevundimonas sp. TaxID=1871086 RepID=UPI0027352360|nr:hypothetical protein [Brevundimonas sp.]MDP3378383.1 hypothetical protein [Brevundimonas sp.]
MPFEITRTVVDELARGRGNGRSAADELASWLHVGLAVEVSLPTEAEEVFLSLVGGSAASTIDDGEAATFAYAVATGSRPVTDDKKAIQIARSRFPDLNVCTTSDLLLHANCRAALGEDGLANCIENALKRALMRVPDEHLDRVVTLLGYERASQCRSLPHWARQGHGITASTSPIAKAS